MFRKVKRGLLFKRSLSKHKEESSIEYDFPHDVYKQLEIDFKSNSKKAITLLSIAISSFDYIRSDRIVRCIVFLSDGSISKLKKNIELATTDPRDVMFCAEYTERDKTTPLRVRNFNNTFQKCEENVRE